MRNGRPVTPAYQRFLAKIEKQPDGCWNWKGWITANGYGQFTVTQPTKRKVYAHRWAYEHWNGPIPEGLVIDHLCRNTACCNPAHLETVTLLENIQRSPHYPGRKTHCKHGHELSGTNVRIDKRGHRSCKACEKRRHEPDYESVGIRVFA